MPQIGPLQTTKLKHIALSFDSTGRVGVNPRHFSELKNPEKPLFARIFGVLFLRNNLDFAEHLQNIYGILVVRFLDDVVESGSNCVSPATPTTKTLEDSKQEQERAAAEQWAQSKRDQLTAERDALQQELNSLKGLFAAFKRKKLQERIDELNRQLRRL